MVMRNKLTRTDGDAAITDTKRPRKFLFDVGEYDVAVHKKRSYLPGNYFIHAQIWDQKTKVGFIDLTTAFDDVKTILSVHTLIRSEYQGLGIAYRVYEGLINQINLAILTDDQSPGAEKLWRRFSVNGGLRLYYIDGYHYGNNLFDTNIYPVMRDDDEQLMTVNHEDRWFSPYEGVGSLLLVRKRSALDSAIQKHIKWNKQIVETARRFRRFDEFRI